MFIKTTAKNGSESRIPRRSLQVSYIYLSLYSQKINFSVGNEI